MTARSQMKKDELIAELDQTEQKLEEAAKSNEAQRAENESLKQQIAQLEANGAVAKEAVEQAPAGQAALNSLGKLKPGEVGESPDGRTHFHSFSGRYRLPVGKDSYAKFEGNRYATEDPETIAQLKKHPAFNREFWVTLEPRKAS